LGVVAISFSLIYATTKIFHVAHAGIYTLAGYLALWLVTHGAPSLVALLLAVAACTVGGTLIQTQLYARLERRRATHLVILIASLGTLAVMQNIIAAVFTPNILQFPIPWAANVVVLGGDVRLTWAQLLTITVSLAAYAGLMWFAHATILGKRIRAVASNPALAQITRLRPQSVYVIVMAIASAIVALPGVLVPLDLGLQPYGGITPLLTATIAMIAGGVGSITGAFALSIVIAELQNLSLLVMPGEWSIGITFFIFVIFMLFRPTGLFVAR
jgi:branched-chain amino acid transport system permease protein